MQKIDRDEYQQILNRLMEILSGMAAHADELSIRRCPYKNRFNQCTAQIGCRNKRKSNVPGSLPVCAGDDKLDYRKAWECA
jgi:hypothetical protein